MDVLLFSKDRAFQLYSLLESLDNFVEGMDTIFVQFSYSTPEYLEGYKKINQYFDNVVFIDETKYGFYVTLKAILENEIKSPNIFLEVDDVLYLDDLNLKELDIKFNKYNASKLLVSFDPEIFDSSFYTIKDDLLIVDKSLEIDNQIQNEVLKYPFNASGAIHRVKDIKEILNTFQLQNPIDLEIKGSTFPTLVNYPYNLYNIKEVCKQIHTNNTLKRYEEIYNNKFLNDLLLNGKVLNLDYNKIKSYPSDMRWFNGENIGRFPIFPWEVAPKYHSKIFNKLKTI